MSYIVDVFREASNIWLKPIHKYYTDHGVQHSERILSICDAMLESLYDTMLCEEEIFILVASAYLHDIGMQMPEYARLEKKEDYTSEEKSIIRGRHHIASEMAIKNHIANKISIESGIIEFIAVVSKYHRESGGDIYKLEDIHYNGKNIRMGLLASILRLCDELDVDNQRIDFNSAEFVALLPETKMHWYSHKYIESITFVDGRITVSLRVPENPRNPDAFKLLTTQFISNIQKRLDGVFKVLHSKKLFVYPRVKIISRKSDIIDDIPADVIEYLLENKRNIKYKYTMENASLSKPMPLISSNYQLIGSHIYLSVGKRFEVGCLDSHFNDEFATSSELIYKRPDYVLRAITPYTEQVTIHVNKSPNIDCFVGVHLIQKLVANGTLDNFDIKIINYCVDSIRGRTKAVVNGNYSLNMYFYAIMDKYDNPRTMINTALTLIKETDEIIRNFNVELDSTDFLEKLKSVENLQEIIDILDVDYSDFSDDTTSEVYIRHLRQRRIPCEITNINLPLQNAKDETVFGVTKGFIWRDVPICQLHWLWPKSDDVLTFVPTKLNEKVVISNRSLTISKYYFSLRGDSQYSLRGLVDGLIKAENEKRVNAFGNFKSSFSERDNWNCPQKHNNTIVVSPQRGSLLLIEEVIAVFNEFTSIPIGIEGE